MTNKSEESFKEFESGAKKDLSGKVPIHLVTKEMVFALAEALQLGIDKGYEANNWQKGLKLDEVSVGSALRHIYKWKSGEDINIEMSPDGKELRVHHLKAAFVNLGMAITQIDRGRTDLDDREFK